MKQFETSKIEKENRSPRSLSIDRRKKIA